MDELKTRNAKVAHGGEARVNRAHPTERKLFRPGSAVHTGEWFLHRCMRIGSSVRRSSSSLIDGTQREERKDTKQQRNGEGGFKLVKRGPGPTKTVCWLTLRHSKLCLTVCALNCALTHRSPVSRM